MGWIAAAVIAVLWAVLAIWALATSGALVLVIGGAVLAIGFAVVAARQWRRSRNGGAAR